MRGAARAPARGPRRAWTFPAARVSELQRAWARCAGTCMGCVCASVDAPVSGLDVSHCVGERRREAGGGAFPGAGGRGAEPQPQPLPTVPSAQPTLVPFGPPFFQLQTTPRVLPEALQQVSRGCPLAAPPLARPRAAAPRAPPRPPARPLAAPPLAPRPDGSAACAAACRRPEWGAAGEVAARVSAVKEGIYQRLTQGGIRAFPGVADLVAQARPRAGCVAGRLPGGCWAQRPRARGRRGLQAGAGPRREGWPQRCALPTSVPPIVTTLWGGCRRGRWGCGWAWPPAALQRRLRATWAAPAWRRSSRTSTW